MKETYRHKGLRKKLVDTIRQKGITDENVLKAVDAVPRHLFMDNAFVEHAYEDKAFPIAEGQTISQPFTVAYMTQLLEIKKGEKVLEVGTGSGYQAAVIAELGAKVFSIERHKKLFQQTQNLLTGLGYERIKLFFGDGYEGIPSFAPFDKIIITAAAPKVPQKLIEQLRIGGMMVLPVGINDSQKMIRIRKIAEDKIMEELFGDFKFVPMLHGKVW